VSIKNDGHYFCRAGGNRPDGLNEPVTIEKVEYYFINHHLPIAKTERPFIVGYRLQRRDKSTPGLTRAGLN
ncbi:hypothetical protein M0735_20710, partial [Salmonella enterica]|nr:hypothetical protein [Salmonella enterica]